MRTTSFAAVLFTALVLPLPFTARAAGQQVISDTLFLSVHDGIRLHTVVTRPPGDGPRPVILVRSPYSGRGGGAAWLASRLVPHGYAVVEQSVRGTGGSEGTFTPFLYDASDGQATLDWVLEQPWAGPVGLWGISYAGWAAYALAETGHPGISAMAVGSAWAELGSFFSPGGAFHLMAHLPWMMAFGSGEQGLPPQGAFTQIFRTVPLATFFEGHEDVGRAGERPYDWSAVDVPALHWTGWYDYVYRSSLEGYSRLRRGQEHGEDQRLIVGPWAHNGDVQGTTRVGPVDFGIAAAAGMDTVAAWTRRFFDEHLRGRPVASDPVRIFVMGENIWRRFETWPPRNAEPRILHLTGEGTLSQEPPVRSGTRILHYDPNDPVPTIGGVLFHYFREESGPRDQSSLDGRPDILRFESQPLPRDVVLAGPIRAVLRIATEAPSTDLTAKLIELLPGGRAEIIEEGIRRIEGTTGGVQEVTVDLGQRALRLSAGSRLRLDVSGGSFPKFDRNPNNGEDPFAATAFEPVDIELYLGKEDVSRVELTVLPVESVDPKNDTPPIESEGGPGDEPPGDSLTSGRAEGV